MAQRLKVVGGLGNATPQTVTKGTTFSSDIGFKQEGSLEVVPREEWVNMTSDDINVELQPNKLYVFPVMASLSYSFTADGEYHFVFFSGETPTEIIHPQDVLTGSLTIEPNRVYEISIIKNSMCGLLLSENWEATL